MDTYGSWEIKPLSVKQEKWLIKILNDDLDWFNDSWYKKESIKRWILEIIKQRYYITKTGLDDSGKSRNDDMEWLKSLTEQYKKNKK